MLRLTRFTRLRVALRTALGFVVLGVGSSVCGAAAVALLLVLQGLPADMGAHNLTFVLLAAGYVAVAVVVGSLWTAFLHRRTALWFAEGRRPTPEEAKRALRLPLHLALISGALWLGGTLLLGGMAALLATWMYAYGVTVAIGAGGLLTVGLV
ncbi:adenylate/guanylate cyclase domain-containing protein, partial [Amycolatopsis bartoniae]